MIINELEVDGFGVWTRLSLADLSDEVNVFYGPNEAGKTTLMQFVRSMLYGFSAERRARYLPPVHGGRAGGSLRLAQGTSQIRVSRHVEGPDEAESLAVRDGQGNPWRSGALTEVLGDIDEATFTNVFAFGLREIQELGLLSDTQAAHLLYDVTLGLDRVSLVDVLRELEASRNRLLAADDRPSLVVQLLGQRERLLGEIDELHALTPRYLDLLEEQQQLAARAAALAGHESQADGGLREAELAAGLAGKWQARLALERQLELIGPVDAMPDDALVRLDGLTSALAAQRERLIKLKRTRRRLTAEAGAVLVNEPLCRLAPRLEALSEQQQWITSLGEQIKRLEGEVGQLEADSKGGAQGGGRAAPIADVGEVPARVQSTLRGHAQALSSARKQLKAAKERIARDRAAASNISGRIEAALGERAPKGLSKALERSGEAVSQLRRRVQLDHRLEAMSRQEADLDEQSHVWLERQLLPTWAVWGLGALFVLGCGMMLLFVSGLTMLDSSSLGWPVGLLGLGAVAAAGLGKIGIERFSASQLDASRRQLDVVRNQIADAKAERDALDKELPRGGGPLVSRLQTAEKELAELESLLPLQGQRDAAARESRAALERKREALADYRKARQRWRQGLRQAGLPESLTPKGVREFFRHGQEARDLGRRLTSRREELADRRKQYELLTARIGQLAGEIGVKPAADPLVTLRQLLADLEQQQERIKRREDLAGQLAQLRAKGRRVERAVTKTLRGRRRLLRQAGAADEAEFRRRAILQSDAERIEREHEGLCRDIRTALLGTLSEERLGRYFDGTLDASKRIVELGGQRQTIRSELQSVFQRQGEVGHELKALLEDRRLPEKQLDLAIVEKRLEDALDRWQELAVCGLMLEEVRQLYERERQPEALREASTYLKQLTGGRYLRVWTPLGEQVLRVDDVDGSSLPVEVLSRGTREQLFLSLRMALVSSYAARGVRLPLVLDDVLVNFDIVRAKAAAAVLRDFAERGHQLLIFTCHEHIAELFQSLGAEVRQLPDNARADQRQSFKPLRRVKEVKPAVEIEVEPLQIEAIAEPIFADLDEPVVAVEPVPARRAKPARKGRRKEVNVERVFSSAEEFEGELQDRVRRVTWHEDAGEELAADRPFDESDDAEAA